VKRSSVVEMLDALEDARVTTVVKPWGTEVIIDAKHFMLKLITVTDGNRTSLQRHTVKDEVIAVIDGEGGVWHDGWTTKAPGVVRNVPGTVHRTVGPVRLIEVTTPQNDDVVRLEDDYGR
jgi:mannose-6-phosphate isomerase-like protein (cupin superfamily)